MAISGLANEYQGYFTTPDEYAWQAYEGGQTNFGKYSANLLVEQTRLLAESMAAGEPAPAAYDFDPTNGLEPDPTPYPDGAEDGVVLEQPGRVSRLGRAAFSWRGGARGTDRPLDRAFVSVERRAGGRWRTVHDDLGTTIEWRVEGNEQVPLGPRYASEANEGRYTAHWEVPLDTTPGRYRFVVTAKRYQLVSGAFPVRRGSLLTVGPRARGRWPGGLHARLPHARPVRRPDLAPAGRAGRRRDGAGGRGAGAGQPDPPRCLRGGGVPR